MKCSIVLNGICVNGEKACKYFGTNSSEYNLTFLIYNTFLIGKNIFTMLYNSLINQKFYLKKIVYHQLYFQNC